MIRINLSPDPTLRLDKRQFFAEAAIAAAAIATAIYAPSFYAEQVRSKSNAISEETSQKQTALQKLKTDNETVNQFKIAISDLKARTEKVRGLSLGRKQPVLVLDKLQQQHPDRLWLEKIELKNGVMSLSGIAAETELISEYALRIKSLNTGVDTTAVDLESFVPPFKNFLEAHENLLAQAQEKKIQSTMPILLSDLNIVRSDLITIQDTSLYRFLINFKVKLPEGI